MIDSLQHFTINQGEYRGTLVHLSNSYQQISQLHDYPSPIQHLLGEALAAISLLGHGLKQPGKLALQVQSSHVIKLLVVEINDHHDIRGLAQWDSDQFFSIPLKLQQGQLALTFLPQHGQQHQGIVPIIGGQLADSLSHYFNQSEQLFTRVLLIANDSQAAGLMIQKMPDFSQEDFALSVEEITLLLQTISPQELLSDAPSTLLHNVFHQHDVTLFDAQAIQFKCTCDLMKMANAVRLLGYEDAMSLLSTHKIIEVKCDFCNQHHGFNADEVQALFQELQ